MAKPLVVTGDEFTVIVNLLKGPSDNLQTFTISGTAEVKARLVSMDHKTTYTEEITQPEANTGSNWAASTVGIRFVGTDTNAITYQGKAKLEIQVMDPDRTTWWVDIDIRRGNIA